MLVLIIVKKIKKKKRKNVGLPIKQSKTILVSTGMHNIEIKYGSDEKKY